MGDSRSLTLDTNEMATNDTVQGIGIKSHRGKDESLPDNDPVEGRSFRGEVVLKTAATYTCFLSMGMHEAIIGPTLLHLVLLFHTDMKTLSACMIVSGVAYVVGSFAGGFMVDRFNREMFFAVSELISMSALIIMPWGRHLYGFAIALLVSDSSMAMIDAGGQSYLLNLWQDSKRKDSVIQGMQFVRAIGSVLAPFLAEPFLVALPRENEIPKHNSSVTVSPGSDSFTIRHYDDYQGNLSVETTTTLSSSSNHTRNTSVLWQFDDELAGDLDGLYRVSYGFLIAGLIGYVGTLLFCFSACRNQRSGERHLEEIDLRSNDDTVTSSSIENTRAKKIYKTVMFSFFFLSFLSYQWIESIPGFFIAAFVVEQLGWDATGGSLITTVFWGAHTFGLLLGIPLSGILPPQTMLGVSLVFTTASVIILTLLSQAHPAVVWVAIATSGLFMSTIFGSNLLLAAKYIKVNGLAAAMFLFGSSVGYMTCYPLTGYLFQLYSPMWMTYLSLISCVTCCGLFIGTIVFHTLYTRAWPSLLPEQSVLELEPMHRNDPEVTALC